MVREAIPGYSESNRAAEVVVEITEEAPISPPQTFLESIFRIPESLAFLQNLIQNTKNQERGEIVRVCGDLYATQDKDETLDFLK